MTGIELLEILNSIKSLKKHYGYIHYVAFDLMGQHKSDNTISYRFIFTTKDYHNTNEVINSLWFKVKSWTNKISFSKEEVLEHSTFDKVFEAMSNSTKLEFIFYLDIFNNT